MRYIASFLLGFIVFVYLLICSILYLGQKDFIYFPTISNQLDDWNQKTLSSHTLYLYQPKNNKKVIVIFHGNAGSAINRSFYNNLFPHEDVIINEYPGYGLNGQEDVSYYNIIFYAKKTMQSIIYEYGKENIILLGESLGSGVASEMAQEYHISHLILVTPYTSFLDLAKHQFAFFPVEWLLRENFDNEKALKNYKGSVTMIVAQNDKVIDPKYALKLYKELNTQKYLFIVQEASHNNWMHFINKEDLNSVEKINNTTLTSSTP